MSSPAPAVLAHRDARDIVRHNRDADHHFLPDFAWATVGGAALITCALLAILTMSLRGGPPVSAYVRELAGGFLAGFLVVLVARTLSERSR